MQYKITTTKEVRDLYVKHLYEKYVSRILGKKDFFADDVCRLCAAADMLRFNHHSTVLKNVDLSNEQFDYCIYCPLAAFRNEGQRCIDDTTSVPYIENGYIGTSPIDKSIFGGSVASLDQLIKRMNWIIDRIHQWTDCCISIEVSAFVQEKNEDLV
ncbi:MAG: hypothetical protein GWN01_09275 [Nitrosopumilaceae archaeon]|nr:hypothetical protein [Nitrosopumilaceae archaeon]NIU87800.1 hypothetical protein [Nitrosopumilaceae archaeon]NIV65183.1 hypothetical protein [Nitrosopumilaceae archaeon]NIX61698.1 hypothetical protein [Nitrosopumilaceae archaeon]